MNINIRQSGKAAVDAGKARKWWSALVQWIDPADAKVSQNALVQIQTCIKRQPRHRMGTFSTYLQRMDPFSRT